MNSTLSRNEFLLQAVACVKASQSLPGASDVPVQDGDAPVVRDLGNGLFVVYR
jgi:hypothetical protein